MTWINHWARCSGLGLALLSLPNFGNPTSTGFAAEPGKAMETLQRVQPGNDGIGAAGKAAKELQSADPKILPDVLNAMDKATPLGRNWLTGVAESLHRRSKDNGWLAAYLKDQSHNGEARALVFEWLTAGNAELRSSMLETMLNDSSPELRYAAIAQALEKGTFDGDDAVQKLAAILDAARHPDQVNDVIKRLKDKGKEVIAAKHFGFIETWNTIGPFDNVGSKSFDVVYPVETALLAGKFNASEKFAAKSGDATWKELVCKPEDGLVELNEPYAKEKGAIVYARATFKAAKDMPADIRLGCTNANKVWLNGELILSNEVYHAGNQIDQYNASAKLKAGENVIVVKVCQNEQTEPWAQDWAFQLRVCDSTGKAILPAK